MTINKLSQLVARHRIAALVLCCTLLGTVVVFAAMAGAQEAPEYDPPLPPSMAEPPGKPQYGDGATPTPDPVRSPSSPFCTTVPGLCGLAQSLVAAHSRGELAAFTSLLSPSQVPCFNPERGARTPGDLCTGQPDSAQVSGYTVITKQARVASEGEFTSFLASRLGLSPGTAKATMVATPLSVGCAITTSEGIDCSVVAIGLGLADGKTKAINDVVVLVFRRNFGGRPFAFVGATAGLVDGAMLTGGPERRLVGGWTGNPTGDWYFEPLEGPGR